MKNTITALHRVAGFGLCAASCLVLSGCLSSTPIWDAHFGEAVKTVMRQQIINPQPAPETGPASTDGKAAVAAMDNYDKSLRTPSPTSNPFVIGIGSGGSMAVSGGAAPQ